MNKIYKFLAPLTIVALLVFVFPTNTNAATGGYSSIGASDYTLATTSLFNPAGLKITLSTGGTVTKASAAVKAASGTHTFNVAIYSDSAGTRGSLISTSVTSVSVGTTYAFVDVTFTSPPVLAAGTYWLQVAEATGNPGITNLAKDTGGATNSSYFVNDNGTVTQYSTDQYSVFITYTPTAASTGGHANVTNTKAKVINMKASNIVL